MIRPELRLKYYKNCLEANGFENKINYLENDKIDAENRITLKLQQRFRSKKHTVFTENINRIGLSADNDKRIQSMDSIKTYTYGTSKDKIRNNEGINYKNITKQYKKMSNFDDTTGKKQKI